MPDVTTTLSSLRASTSGFGAGPAHWNAISAPSTSTGVAFTPWRERSAPTMRPNAPADAASSVTPSTTPNSIESALSPRMNIAASPTQLRRSRSRSKPSSRSIAAPPMAPAKPFRVARIVSPTRGMACAPHASAGSSSSKGEPPAPTSGPSRAAPPGGSSACTSSASREPSARNAPATGGSRSNGINAFSACACWGSDSVASSSRRRVST